MANRELLWKAVLAINVVVPLAGGIVLFLWPGFVPATVGIALAPQQYLIAYLLGGTEFAFALLCALAMRSDSSEVRRMVASVAIAFHGLAGVATVLAWLGGTTPLVLINTAARAVMVALFAGLGLRAEREPSRR